MMERSRCTDIQVIISAAYDGSATDHDSLAAAKAHCHTCAECADFVALLASMRRLPAPVIPADALERTLAAVRTEMAAASEKPAVATQSAEKDAGSEETRETRPGVTAEPIRLTRDRWRSWAPWAAAAAVFLLAAGVVTAQGVRYLLSPTSGTMTASDTASLERSSEPESDSLAGPAEGGTAPGDDGIDISGDASTLSGPAYVTLSDRVYVFESTIEQPPAGTPTGNLTSSLDSGAPAIPREVWTAPDSDAIVVAGDDGAYLRFTPVSRSFRGRTYVMRAPMISSFGVWPSLPPAVPKPSTPDGGPELFPAGSEDSGVPVFAPPGTDPASGFAIAPGTASGDPAAGNPGWTWWEPASP